MLPVYFGPLCELVNQLATLEAALAPSAAQSHLHRLVHRFDAVLDQVVEAAFLETPASNNDEAPDGL